MATILLVGTDVPLLEGLAQTLAAVGHTTQLASTLAEAMEVAGLEPPLVAVIDRALIVPSGDALRIPLARGGTLVVYRPDGASAAPLPVAVQRATLADLRLPLERQRLVALLQSVETRARSTGRDRIQTPPDRHPRA
jgi:ActR/RegA family two-component response regulator